MTLAGLLADLERRAAEAERIGATAPVAALYRALGKELLALDDTPASPDGDRLLTPAEAAAALGVTKRWIYDNVKKLPFRRHLSRRCLRFSEAGLRRWVPRRTT